MSRHLKSDVIHRLHSTIAESSQTSASCGVSFCARGSRYLDLTDAIVYYRGRVNTLKEARHYGKNLILRPSRSRRFKGKHVLYTCHILPVSPTVNSSNSLSPVLTPSNVIP